jgi:hypothetical protein
VLAWLLLTAGLTLTPAPAHAQGDSVPPPDFEIPVPLGHDRMDKGGLYLFGEFVMYRQTNPLRNQVIAFRGFQDLDGSIDGVPGKFIGSHTPALNVTDADGPITYQPGFKFGIGWRFENGWALDLSYLNLQKAVYPATASIVPQGGHLGDRQADSFLFSPVFNFPNDYAGPIVSQSQLTLLGSAKVALGLPGATFGIWNAASIMSESFTQRYSEADSNLRVPIFETECWRTYGLVGPRFAWIWEKFQWRTVSEDLQGNATPFDVAIYNNIVSNRMYGVHCGFGNDWYLGHGVGISLEADIAGLLDIVKERANYQLGAKNAPPISKRSITEYTVVPEPSGNLQVWWYPHPAVQVRFGWDVKAFFNTIGSRNPVDFDWGRVSPAFDHIGFRGFDGFNAGIGVIF